jgi:hypothetical protein
MSAALDMGRKSLLTEELADIIKGFVGAGVTLPIACEAAGVKWDTVKDWLKRGRAGDEPYATFVQQVSQAKALRKVALRLVITNQAKRGDWRAAAYDLEHDEATDAHNAKLRRQRLLAHGGGDDDSDRVILLYPVPVPLGAELSQLSLAPGHAIDTSGYETTREAMPADDDKGEP